MECRTCKLVNEKKTEENTVIQEKARQQKKALEKPG